MIGFLFLALGLVLLIEGLVYALAPSFIEDMLAAIRQLTLSQRRTLGLLTMVAGVFLLWCASALGVAF